jgi:hypothetical protein
MIIAQWEGVFMATVEKEKIKPAQAEEFEFQADDANQVLPPPVDSGYNDEPDRHRGLPGTGITDETPPRNKSNGQPGFDAAEKIRRLKYNRN